MEQKNRQQTGSQGTGSAEQTGRERSEQQQQTNRNKQEQKDIAQQAGIGRKQITTPDELGTTSGRDDYAGGSGNVMDDQSTGGPTDS